MATWTYCFFSLFCLCDSYKILAVLPVPMHSHYTLSSRIVDELVRRGHEVTFVTPFLRHQNTPNLKEVSVETVVPAMNERKKHLFTLDDRSLFSSVQFLTEMGYILTEETLKNHNLQQLLVGNNTYDLVLLPQFNNEAFLPIAQLFHAPLVLISPMPLFSWGNYLLSLPSPSSYVPNLLSTYTGRMTFWQRLWNTLYDVYSIGYHQWVVLPKHRELSKKYIPGGPDLYRFLNNASLLLVNSHVSSYNAMVKVPNVVEIGGFHIQQPKEVPEDMQSFLDQSQNGVVVFSMGSNLNTSSLEANKIQALMTTFSKLPQNVLFKWETEEFIGRPQNVKIIKWLPQSDVLAHPNVHAFITHGGLFSTMESIYHGVPVVGIPVFADQKMNMATAVSCGYAVIVPFQEMTEDKLARALDQVLNDPKYRNNVRLRSKIMKDRPVKPIDLAVYWMEYVVRHQGAGHLRYPGMDLNWFQRCLLDVVCFIVFVIIAVFVVSGKFVGYLNKKSKIE